ncbi:MAG: PfkB family carbohydrate kinase [Thermoplasmata archaeon]|nr:PfkB family carbohydrate kinase [Thermoplasmata archaeon]
MNRGSGLTPSLDLLVAGHTNLDRFLSVRTLPSPDRTAPLLDSRVELGGTAANIAIAASHWGVRTGIASRVGPDFPEDFVRTFRRAGVDVRGLERVRGERTPTAFIVTARSGSQMTLIDQGAMADASTARLPRPLIVAARWVHLTTGDPDYQLRIQAVCRRLGRPVAADPAQEIHYRWDRRRLRTLLSGAEILFGNAHEIRRTIALLGASGISGLLETVPLVVETRGTQGAAAYTRERTILRAAERPKQIRTLTGAGDAFRGGFYAGWLSGQPLERSLVAGLRSARCWIEDRAQFVRHKNHARPERTGDQPRRSRPSRGGP